MKETFRELTKVILNDYLRLQRGDALSVNAEESNLEEAKYLANEAINVTGANVKIVTTIDGKPQEVIEFDAPDQLTTKITGLAMVRLVSKSDFSVSDASLISASNLPFMQKIGHLAQPLEIGRRIVVPWCVVDVDSPVPVYKKPFDSLSKLSEEVKYRQSYMRHMDIHIMHFKGKDCDFTVELPEDVYFVGGVCELSNGRSYISSVDFDRLSFTVDKNSLNGYFTGLVNVAGQKVSINFNYKNGKLVEYTSHPILDRILALDDCISKPGLILLRDREAIVMLGGSDTMSLAEKVESEEELPDNFNTSLFTVSCLLDSEICITVTDCDGREKELVRKGYFVE